MIHGAVWTAKHREIVEAFGEAEAALERARKGCLDLRLDQSTGAVEGAQHRLETARTRFRAETESLAG